MKIKRILSFILAIMLLVTLSSCDKLNYTTPYGTLNDKSVASAQNVSVGQKELYNRLRSNAYSNVVSKIEEALLTEYIAKTSYSNESDKKRYDELIFSDLFSTYSNERIKEYPQTEINKAIQKYIDKLFLEHGLQVHSSDINYDINDGDDAVGNFSEEIANIYTITVAKEKFARDYLTDEVLLEKIDDEKNPVYITEDDIENQYEIIRKYGTKQAIVIRYSSYKEAFDDYEIIKNKLGYSLDSSSTFEQALNFYVELYNLRYSFYFSDGNELTIDNYQDSDKVTFIYNDKKNELYSLNSVVYSNFDKFEDQEFTITPKNMDNSYTMLLRIGEQVAHEEEKFSELSDSVKQTIKQEIIEQLIEVRLTTTYIQQKLQEIIDDSTLDIYDPLFDYYYAQGNSNYNRTKSFNNELVFKLVSNSKTYELKVNDFYQELVLISGLEQILDILASKYVVNNSEYSSTLDSDAIKEIENDYKAFVKDFKKKPEKTMGLDNYLLVNFGYNNKNDVINYHYKANQLKQVAYDDLGNLTTDAKDEFLTTGTIFDIFEKYTRRLHDNYFNLEIEHILISIDYNNDGNMDDPKLFKEKLTPAQAAEFDKNIASLAMAIVKEADMISKSTIDSLKAIQKNYQTGEKVWSLAEYDEDDKLISVPTWNDFKWNYNISLTVESLGSLNNTSALNYVPAFSIRAKELYAKLTAEDDDFDDEVGYLEHIGVTDLTVEDLTYTNYGYHILNVANITENNSALSTADSDYKLDSNDVYKRYEHIRVVLDEKDLDDEDDDIFAYTNAYSENDYPSTQQLFIYYFENKSTSSSTSFRTSTKQAISAVFDGFLSRFNNAIFREYRLQLRLGTITFDFEGFNDNLQIYNQIKERELDSYADVNSSFYNYTGWFNENWVGPFGS